MRTVLAAIFLVCAVLFAALFAESVFDNVEPMSRGETVEGLRYEVAAEGNDLRVYEWESPSGAYCIAVAGSQKMGLQCAALPRADEEEGG